MKILTLDGSRGGGQMLRTALSLSMITGQSFRMSNIRGRRAKPGLMRQHLTCVKAAQKISDAEVRGAEMGSTEIMFQPREISAGSYEFAIGTAGSTSLLYQTLLPALSMAKGESMLRLSGGTHQPMAPCFEFLDRVFLRAIRAMGFDAELSLIQTGFVPVGGGVIESVIRPARHRSPLHLMERGALRSSQVRVPVRSLERGIAKRVLEATLAAFPCEDARIDDRSGGPGQGIAAMIECDFEHCTELVCIAGEVKVSAETLGKRVGRSMEAYLQSGVPVGRYLADQLMLPMALSGGGALVMLALDEHVSTNQGVIEAFLPVQFTTEALGEKCWKLSCAPR